MNFNVLPFVGGRLLKSKIHSLQRTLGGKPKSREAGKAKMQRQSLNVSQPRISALIKEYK